MDFRSPGSLPFHFRLNRLMIAGMAVTVLGLALYALGMASSDGGPSPWDGPAYGAVLAGIALYFIGRVVQLWTDIRRR